MIPVLLFEIIHCLFYKNNEIIQPILTNDNNKEKDFA